MHMELESLAIADYSDERSPGRGDQGRRGDQNRGELHPQPKHALHKSPKSQLTSQQRGAAVALATGRGPAAVTYYWFPPD